MYLHVICMSVVFTHNIWHATRMYLNVIRMSLICHPHVTRIYLYFIRLPLVCTRMSSAYHSYLYVLEFHPYVNRVYSYVLRMSLVCTRMSSVCHQYVLVCSCSWFYHEPHIGSIAIMLLHDLEAKRSLFHTICLLQRSKQIRNKLKYKSSSSSESIYCKQS